MLDAAHERHHIPVDQPLTAVLSPDNKQESMHDTQVVHMQARSTLHDASHADVHMQCKEALSAQIVVLCCAWCAQNTCLSPILAGISSANLVCVDDAVCAEHGARVRGHPPSCRHVVPLMHAHLRNTPSFMGQTPDAHQTKGGAKQALVDSAQKPIKILQDIGFKAARSGPGPMHTHASNLVADPPIKGSRTEVKACLHGRQPALVFQPAKVQVHELRGDDGLRHGRQALLRHRCHFGPSRVTTPAGPVCSHHPVKCALHARAMFFTCPGPSA